jgi:uncharacterized membrane protein
MRRAALLVTVLCLVALAVGGAGGTTHPQAQQSPQPQSSFQAQQSSTAPAEDGVDITVQLQPDGDARWNVSTSYVLQTENDTRAFQRLAERFKDEETDGAFSVAVFRAAVPQVSESVNRSMEIRGVHRRATTIEGENNSTGVLSLQFTWTNFSQVDNETVVVDAFTGSWFGNLQTGQTLTIRPPQGYDTESVQPGPSSITDGAYRWQGPRSFADGQPSATFTATPDNGGVAGFSPMMLILVGAGALLFGGIAVWLYNRGGLGDVDWFGGADESVDSPNSGTGGASGESSGAAAAGAGAATGGAAGEATTNPELLSDEERVEQLLREHDGRMKQSKIVEETRWSHAKVSQLLTSMEDEDRIEKLRIGRENLISLPGEGVED